MGREIFEMGRYEPQVSARYDYLRLRRCLLEREVQRLLIAVEMHNHSPGSRPDIAFDFREGYVTSRADIFTPSGHCMVSIRSSLDVASDLVNVDRMA